MCGEEYVVESKTEAKKNLNMRDMLKITRKLNEQVGDENNDEKKLINRENVFDQREEEEKLESFFDDLNVSIQFNDLKVYDDLVFWSGVVNGIIEFAFTVTPYDDTSAVTFDYTKEFSPDNPDNDLIIKKLETYYDTIFKKYWKSNMIQQ
jgi:hypothetical protein